MTFAPATLRNLAAYWIANGGVNLGIVGDTDHAQKGVSYHLGKDQLAPGAYSATLPRDVAGLTNAASAIDLGKLNGTYGGLRDFSRWLVTRCQARQPGSRDIREIIYSPDGRRVQRYSGVDNLIHTGAGNGDSSHLTHTHVSYYRDSESRDKRPLWTPYFTAEEPEMRGFVLDPLSTTGLVTISIDGAMAVRLDDNALIPVGRGQVKDVMGFGKLLTDLGTEVPSDPNDNDRKSGYLLKGTRPAWLLKYAGTFVPDADMIPRQAAIAAIEELP